MDRNQHVKDYLAYYVGFPSPPRFAVLLNGPWGIGKTFLVKEFMKPFADRGLRYVYVSLYGLTSLDEIDDALFRAMYPLLDNKGVQLAGRAAKALGKYFRVDVDLHAKDVLNKANSDLFIFDDLERCDLPINRVLGYINEFVEHEDRKVIIIANEKEIKGGEDYGRIREKLIGKTLEIQSAFEQALEAFTGSIQDSQAKTFLTSKTDTISEVYHQSELNNLRVLQQTMWDFERLYVALEDKHRNSDAAMTALLRLVFALSFELKAGRLTADDLLKRQFTLVASLMRSRREEGDPPPIATAQKRYPEVDLGSTTLSDQTLVNLLTKGIVDSDQIRGELDASWFFVTVADEPPWRTVWHAFERTDEELNTALAEMERAFDAREYTISGEILHVFGLRLWMSKIGAIPKSLEEVVAEGRAYIDDLYASGRLELPSAHDDFSDMRFSGYGGLGIHENSTPEYRALYIYLRDKRQVAAVDRYPLIADELLADMEADPDLFLHRICLTNDGANEFYSMPVLASLDPNRFATVLLEQHPARQRTVLIALKARYEHGKLDRELREEQSWATDVRNRLYAEAEGLPPISKYRVRQNLHYTLDEVLGLGAHAAQGAGAPAGQPE